MLFLDLSPLVTLGGKIAHMYAILFGSGRYSWVPLIGFLHPIICPIVAHRRGHSAWLWFAHGCIFGLFATITVFMLSQKPRGPKGTKARITLDMPLPPVSREQRRKYVRFLDPNVKLVPVYF